MWLGFYLDKGYSSWMLVYSNWGISTVTTCIVLLCIVWCLRCLRDHRRLGYLTNWMVTVSAPVSAEVSPYSSTIDNSILVYCKLHYTLYVRRKSFIHAYHCIIVYCRLHCTLHVEKEIPYHCFHLPPFIQVLTCTSSCMGYLCTCTCTCTCLDLKFGFVAYKLHVQWNLS